ncbi:serpin family protein [Gloeocapsopsis dulcis]|uniref:Proteinase inhibitor I4 serpin n=1 Tax=Gloeocapsopsis dulcis AAB1 = 1H9 TaxID=1433147 RepID=A0A6N8FRE0_9CHRO|nr:serpin family protein [Gloeocapsopsis dulcis]MUL35162.1 proteinase inhibitor I4 serpin [Gloeocapsopsis dulcis AAB1 = 1H9]WNN89044.1 serpin family protein [Gloeocapsopsis dulcis]
MQRSFLLRRYAICLGRRYVLAATGILFIGMMGCSRIDRIDSVVAQPRSFNRQDSSDKQMTSSAVKEIVSANTRFGFKLFSQLLRQDSSSNVFISPTSIAIALAMLYNGANGETQQAMAQTLELQGISLPEINTANAALLSALTNPDANVQIAIANSLWARQEYPFRKDFLQKNQSFYKAQVTNLDFASPDAKNTINAWVNQNTNGRIEQIVDQINPEDVLFLINAIYFKGRWADEFDPSQTTNEPFFTNGGSTQHPMMAQTGRYRYYENDQFQAVSLPYGKGRLSLYVFLPRENSNLTSFYQQLNSANWEKWLTQFNQREGSIRLPRFQMEYDLTLNDTLKVLGMEVAFEDNADFSAMGNDLALSEVKHKTFVEVNEEGTEAAAVTSGRVMAVSAPLDPPFEMIVNRPFFCAIRDNQTGTVLFMGSIVEP